MCRDLGKTETSKGSGDGNNTRLHMKQYWTRSCWSKQGKCPVCCLCGLTSSMDCFIKGGSLADWYRKGLLKHLYRLNNSHLQSFEMNGIGCHITIWHSSNYCNPPVKVIWQCPQLSRLCENLIPCLKDMLEHIICQSTHDWGNEGKDVSNFFCLPTKQKEKGE